jgi:radical SAM protein with 4Fe4S-binding SPASM domain
VRSALGARVDSVAYAAHLYGAYRRANRRYSAEHDMAASPFPRWIQFQTINACQASCTMCPYPLYKDVFARGRMDDALFDKILAEVAARSDVDALIPMLQNEPFLDKRLFDKVTRIKEATGGRVRVELVTNGALLTEENIARIRLSRVDVLDVSLDAVSRDVYRRVRVGLDFDAVIAGVERLIAARLPDTKVFVRLVRVRDNAREVTAFARQWRAQGVPVFIYTAHDRAGSVDGFDARVRLPEQELTWLQRMERRASRRYMGHCPVPFAMTSILHDGQMLMCVHDWGRKVIVGNVRDATIAELWNGDRMREIRRAISERRYADVAACRDCSLWKDGWF